MGAVHGRGWLAMGAFGVALLAVILLSRGQAGDLAAAGQPRPNIVIYLVDTLRADHLGVYGYGRDTSPVLDRWAQGGVVFEQAYAPSSWTKPSMVSLFSGLDPISHGVEDRLDVIPENVQLLAERLKGLGYSTFGAVTNPNVLPQWGFGRGFDEYADLDSNGHGTPADKVSDYVAQKIEELSQNQPFLLYLHVIDPHFPYQPPPPYDTRFPRSRAVPVNMSMSQYDGEVAFVDSQFGRLLDLLGEHGLDDDTLTIFAADHGEEFWEHGALGHGGTLFEEVVRVPLVIRFPQGRHAGTRVDTRVTLSDLFPTMLGLLGESLPSRLDGADLNALLHEGEPDWVDRDLLLSLRTSGQNSHLLRGVLRGPHKYLRRTRPEAAELLFDIERDPAESTNLAAKQAEARADLAASLDAHLGKRSSGVHLRIVSEAAGDAVGAEVQLRTTGRFTGVSGVRLEPGDRLEVSEQGQRLHLNLRLVNRHQQLSTGNPRLVPDEDGVVFQVSPPNARIVVERLRLDRDQELSLHAGVGRGETKVPFAFEATDSAWRIRDVGELLAGAGRAADDSSPKAYVGVIRAPAQRTEQLPRELLERLRSLGYLGGSEDVE